ncbi:MAG: hypothetical protein H6815_00245 [Phycisphaeraceae bacterium]|nr:hypothetical protein [Phycisphaerales bacterium]MCB9858854.1 hypothetical protein [Phycisphaeraceae bacterium]
MSDQKHKIILRAKDAAILLALVENGAESIARSNPDPFSSRAFLLSRGKVIYDAVKSTLEQMPKESLSNEPEMLEYMRSIGALK